MDLYEVLQNDINDFSEQGRVFICCDLNARVGNCNKCDYIVNDRLIQDIDGEEYEPDKPIQRVSTDRVVNSHGRKLIM